MFTKRTDRIKYFVWAGSDFVNIHSSVILQYMFTLQKQSSCAVLITTCFFVLVHINFRNILHTLSHLFGCLVRHPQYCIRFKFAIAFRLQLLIIIYLILCITNNKNKCIYFVFESITILRNISSFVLLWGCPFEITRC